MCVSVILYVEVTGEAVASLLCLEFYYCTLARHVFCFLNGEKYMYSVYWNIFVYYFPMAQDIKMSIHGDMSMVYLFPSNIVAVNIYF